MTVLRTKRKHFRTPIEIGTKTIGSGPPDATQDIDEFLEKRRKRLLARAQDAELSKAATQDELDAARLRKEKDRTEKTEGLIEEEDMETTQKKVEDAAEVAAEAVSAGVDTKDAKELASGKKKVVVVKSKAEDVPTGQEAKGGWSVLNGKPVKDPEGEYTFLQALKVCELERPKETGNSPIPILDWAEKKGLLGPGKSDEFMSSFMTQLAKQSVDNIVKPTSTSHSSDTDALRAEMRELREQVRLATDPVESAKRVKELYTTYQGLGLIQTGGGEESLDSLKEKHRHMERMDELQTERTYKESIATSLGDVVERAGRGFAHQMLEEGGGAEEPGGAALEYFACTHKLEGGQLCGARILMPPGATEYTCPKCNTIYDLIKK